MKHLLKEYQRKLKTYQEDMNQLIREGDDVLSIMKLTIKIRCYKEFIEDMRPLVPADKPIDPKILEAERKEQEQRERERDERDEAFRARLMAAEEPVKLPPGFEDFEACGGK
jgi:hypothetical protein